MQTLFRLLAIPLSLCALAYAQTTGSLNGVVTDHSGAAIVGAVVELTSLQTQTKRSTASGSSGNYNFAQLSPGQYRLQVSAPGFSIRVFDKVEILVNTPTTVPVSLEVGAVSESVAVVAEATLVNTTDASLGNAIDTHAIIELPSEARNPAGLLALQAGVTYVGQGSTYGVATGGTISTADRLNGSVNGSKPDQNNITLDGVDVNDQNTRAAFQSVLRVTLDSVQEFRTTTLNPTADQGRGSGAQIALVTKSGTNEMHGSVYEFTRNTLTSANSFFNNRSGIERQKLIRNLFGTSLGGP